MIPWHRIAEYQRVTLKLIAMEVLSACPSISTDVLTEGLYFPGEINCAMLCLEKPVVLMVSDHNPGAADLANELEAAFDGITISPVSAVPSRGRGFTRSLEENFFLLYLNKHTFLNEAGEYLAAQVREVHRRTPKRILLVHENDIALDPCEFGRSPHRTPLLAYCSCRQLQL